MRWHSVWQCALAAALGLALALAAAGEARAVEPDEMLADAALEHRARALSAGLRCLVCQNQSIDDSNAPLARDLRLLVRERLQAGDGDAAVLDFIVARYGEYVLLRPRIGAHTVILWLTPLLLLLAIAAVAWTRVRSPPAPTPAPLTADEKARLEAILEDRGGGPGDRG